MADKPQTSFDVAYEEALDLARSTFLKKDITALCTSAGAAVTDLPGGGRTVEIPFLNRTATITLPECEFSVPSGEPVHVWEKILILHYLLGDNTANLSGTMINYRRVKDGATYYATFEKRSIKPLIATFGSNPDLLYGAAQCLAAEKIDYGDAGVCIRALPHVPLQIILWKGDDEFAPDGSILFDETIEQRLSAEDIAVLCQQVVLRIIRCRKDS